MSSKTQDVNKLIETVEKMDSMIPGGIVQDADTILVDCIEKCNHHYAGLASDIFNIYLQSSDKKAVEQMFYEFTGIEFVEYLEKCIETMSENQPFKDAPKEVLEVCSIAKKFNIDKDALLMEAELVEQEGEWLHLQLMGYAADAISKAAELLD